MTWFEAIPSIAISIALLQGVGGTLGYFLGLRGLWLWGSAAPLTIGLVSVAGIIGGAFGLPWGWVLVLSLTLFLLCVALAIRKHLPRFVQTERLTTRWMTTVPLLAVGALIGARLLFVLSQPDAISQTFDNNFHLNAVRFILEQNNASTLRLGRMLDPGTKSAFYPAAWHGAVSLIALANGGSISVAANSLTIAVSVVVWPAGMLLLVRSLIGAEMPKLWFAAIFTAATPTFPLLPLTFGVLYPFFLGISILPAALALGAAIFGLARSDAPRPSRQLAVIIFCLGIPALAISHPSVLVTGMLALLGMSAIWIAKIWNGSSAKRRMFAVLLVLLILLATTLAFVLLRPPPTGSPFGPSGSLKAAIWQIIDFGAYNFEPNYVLGGVLAVGLVFAFARADVGKMAATALYLSLCGLFVLGAAWPRGASRYWLLGTWYEDPNRPASLLAIGFVPILVLGALAVAAFITRWRSGILRVGGLVLFSTLIVITSQLFGMHTSTVNAANSYRSDMQSKLLTPAEASIISSLDKVTNVDDVIAVDPWKGGALAYALADREVTMPHAFMNISEPLRYINRHLNQIATNPKVCEMLVSQGVTYVLFFDGQTVIPRAKNGENSTSAFSGFTHLEPNWHLESVLENQGLKLFRVKNC